MGKQQAEKHDVDQHLEESAKRKDKAFTNGILSKSQRLAASEVPIGPHVRKLDGKDIVKRASTRKNRFLLVLNVQLAPAAAGRLGTLAKLDTANPVLYIEFPQGRLKLLGTLVFPRNKYMVLRPGSKEVLAEDVLESMIVFSEAVWVGTLEANPSEAPLSFPPELDTAPPLHTTYSYDAGAGAGASGVGVGGASQHSPAASRGGGRGSPAGVRPGSPAGVRRPAGGEEGDGPTSSDDALLATQGTQLTQSQRPKRTTASKRPRYKDTIDLEASSEDTQGADTKDVHTHKSNQSDDNDDNDDNDDDDNGGGGVSSSRGVGEMQSGATSPASESMWSVGEDTPPPRTTTKQKQAAQRNKGFKGKVQQGVRGKVADGGGEEGDAWGEEGLGTQGLTQTMSSQRPQRAAHGQKKRVRDEDSEEEEEEEESDESEEAYSVQDKSDEEDGEEDEDYEASE